MAGRSAHVRLAFVALVIVVLVGCEGSVPVQQVADPDSAWRTRQAADMGG